MKATMYMVVHKDTSYIPKGRTPIFVGNGNNGHNYIRDNSGVNIAKKNDTFCELTAMYWIWKNDNSSDFVSLEHYRRFFSNRIFPHPISKQSMVHLLEKYDAIILKRDPIKKNVAEHYAFSHSEKDLKLVHDAIKRLYPEYETAYFTVMEMHKLPLCNMIAISKDKYNAYCEWLFDIIFSIEPLVNLEDKDNYQRRCFGFIAERLLFVWLIQNKYSYIELPVYFKDKNFFFSIVRSYHKWFIRESKPSHIPSNT